MQTSQFATSRGAKVPWPHKYVFAQNHGFHFPNCWIQLLVSKETHQVTPQQIKEELCLTRKFSSWIVQQNLKMYHQGQPNCYYGDSLKIKSYNKAPFPVTVLVLPTPSLILVAPADQKRSLLSVEMEWWSRCLIRQQCHGNCLELSIFGSEEAEINLKAAGILNPGL